MAWTADKHQGSKLSREALCPQVESTAGNGQDQRSQKEPGSPGGLLGLEPGSPGGLLGLEPDSPGGLLGLEPGSPGGLLGLEYSTSGHQYMPPEMSPRNTVEK